MEAEDFLTPPVLRLHLHGDRGGRSLISDPVARTGKPFRISARVPCARFPDVLMESGFARGVSRATANRHWAYAKAWLRSEILAD